MSMAACSNSPSNIQTQAVTLLGEVQLGHHRRKSDNDDDVIYLLFYLFTY